MASRYKRAHKTHAFDQRAGEAYPHGPDQGLAPDATRATDEASRMFAELCELVPDASTRAALVGVSHELDEAWRRGERLPILRAHRKSIERALKTPQPS